MANPEAILRLLVALAMLMDISPEELYMNYLDCEKCQRYYDRLLALIEGLAKAA